MFNPIKLYRDQQAAELEWILEHPVKFAAYNAILIAVFIGALELWDRHETRKLEETAQMIQNES
jgi:hypothetical protein